MSIGEGIRQDETWLSVDPVVGCSLDCQYCFLKSYNKTPTSATEMLDPEETIVGLLENELYNPATPIMFGSETDVFSNNRITSYYLRLLDEVAENELPNRLVFVTKSGISEDFIKRGKDNGLDITYYVSYSGLAKFEPQIEPNVSEQVQRDNFEVLSAYNVPTVHYWRPLLPQNTTPEAVSYVIDHVAQYTNVSFVGGLKINPGIQKYMEPFWLEISSLDATNRDICVWPEGSKDMIRAYVGSSHPYHNLFWLNTCSLAKSASLVEQNVGFGSSFCETSLCDPSFREKCSQVNTGLQYRVFGQTRLLEEPSKSGITDKKSNSMNTKGTLHEWRGALAGGKDIELPCDVLPLYIPSKKINIGMIVEVAKNLRVAFRAIERKPWMVDEYIDEIIVQVGHLSDALMRSDVKFSKQENMDEIIGDECGDIILNSLFLADELGLDLENLVPKRPPYSFEGVSNRSTMRAIQGLVTELIEISRKEDISRILSGIIGNAVAVCVNKRINVNAVFRKIEVESLRFIDSRKPYLFDELHQILKNVPEFMFEDINLAGLKLEEISQPLPQLPDVHIDEPLRNFVLLRGDGLSPSAIFIAKEELNRYGILVERELIIDDYLTMARRIYGYRNEDPQTYLWYFLSRQVYGEIANKAHVLVLDNDIPDPLLRSAKNDIRQKIPTRFFKVTTDELVAYPSWLHHAHSPESSELSNELDLLRRYGILIK